ncbi:MAG TPA: hypothetical protein VEU30_10915, partial [Thermoanaerobaculia bacterium]|nr:hypothetical protein [Thermoanaerobaculia bacterium]
MDFLPLTFNFPLRDGEPVPAKDAAVFPRPVVDAVAAITGYSVQFGEDDESNVGRIVLRVTHQIEGSTVKVEAYLGIRDWSGEWDDRYGGHINVLVMAELEPVTAPPPRRDLIITGAEVTQTIQSFRSAQHLAPPNILPDNAIPLIAGKPTGLRFWVDYDRDADNSLPDIADLTGELEVRASTGTFTLGPLARIAPRRDAEIDRGQADHTLTFAIPAQNCNGIVSIRCRVFDGVNGGPRSLA